MKIAILLAFGSLVTALPNLNLFTRTKHHCLTQERAQYIVDRERVYLQKADPADARAAGEELFSTDGFVQYSDSINSLRGDPVSLPSEKLHFGHPANTFDSSAPSSNQMQRHT